MKRFFKAALLGVVLGATAAAPVSAKTFRYAYVSDVNSLDPYSLSESFSISFLQHIYEPLVRYNENLEIEPALATSWENISPTVIRFKLREGVTYHDGADFNADDVVVSFTRALNPNSPIRSNLTGVEKVTKVDAYTVDMHLTTPSPIIFNFISNLVIMDSGWLEKNNSMASIDSTKGEENYASTHTNGTGPFILESRRPDSKTVLVVNPKWWDTPKHNLTKIEFTPVASDATRVAALLSGELDMIYPSPLQDSKRISAAGGVNVLEGPSLRTIMLGFNMHDKLNDPSVTGDNPFKNLDVRMAFAKSVNLDLIRKKIMRGKSRIAGLLVAPEVPGFRASDNTAVAQDVEGAKALLAKAGYPDGFQFLMNCPNDRYVNDEEICQAIAGMLAKSGLKAKLTTETKGLHFKKARAGEADVFMLGWATLPMLDSFSTLSALLHTPKDKFGSWNPGGYSNATLDKLTEQSMSMIDLEKRKDVMADALKIAKDEMAWYPIHQQPLSWAVRDNVSVVQSPDNKLRLWYTQIK